MATIYLLKGYVDYAAASLADAQSLLTALADPTTSANAKTIGLVQDRLEILVQSDTGEPLTISSIDDTAGTISSWVTDNATTLAVGLGDPDPNTGFTYASTTSFTISGNTRIGTLALNTTSLRGALAGSYSARNSIRCGANPAYAVPSLNIPFTLQIRKTTNGVTETMGIITTLVKAGILSSTPTDLAATSYVTTAQARAGYLINLSSVTSLTGGGATTLDGQTTLGGVTFPVGCIVCLSFGDVSRLYKLKGTYLAATSADLSQIKPTDSDATTNPCYWQSIG